MKRSVTAIMVLLTSMFYAVFCQAQIVGTGQLGAARRGHTATLLQDGKILIVGGDNANGLVGQAEIFDPASLTSSNIPSNPIALRTDHTATLLADGRVLIIGGVDGNGLLASSEFYNPNSVPAPSFSTGPALMRARSGHTATVLSDGKILIAGGEASGSAEIFDPATQSFSLVGGSLNTPRQYHSAVLLNSGKVLIAGGVVGANTTLTSAEIYDPQTQSFIPASGAMQTPRGLALLRVLPDGKVQVIGGDGEFSMEMFDPATNSFIALAHIPPYEDYLNNILASRTRSALITTIIQQNPVLQGQPELTAEIIALLNRLDHTVTEIPQSNRALIAGGVNDAGQILSSATLVSSSAATITTDKFDYAPGEIVTITGQGWQPNETVWMLFHEEPETHPDVTISSVADGQGNFTSTDFAPAQNDLNRNFTLTAIGQSSGFTAQTAFKDAFDLSSITVLGTQTTNPVPSGSSTTYGTTATTSVRFRFSAGTGTTCLVNTLTVENRPAGVTATFAPTTVTGTSGSDKFSLLTISTTGATAPGTYSTLHVRGRESTGCSNNGNQVDSADFTLVVSAAPTATTLTLSAPSPASVTYGSTGPVTLSATLTRTTGGTAVSGATVTFTVDGSSVGTAVTNGSGVASITTYNPSALTATSHNVQATFAQQTISGTTYAASTSGTQTLTVNKKNATWTTNAASKTYGDADPIPLTTGSGSGFLAADNVTATYSRVAGENASPPTYHITATLSAAAGVLANYNITNTGAEFTINKRNATWTTNAASKTYGDADPVPLTTGSGSNFTDTVTATYSRVTGENASPPTYHITATLSAAAGVLANYNITNTGAEFTINKRNATWTTDPNSKTYGDVDPIPLTTGSGTNFTDTVTATYSRVAGENASPPTYHITATLSAAAGVLANYNITNTGAEFTINKRNATWTTNAASKTYGDVDPVGLTTGSGSNFTDTVTATYSRVAGESPSPPTYHITATLSAAAGVLANYNITNAGAEFTINKRNATWTTDPNSKTYGDADPIPLTTGSGSNFTDTVTATYSRVAGENASPPTYHITATLSAAVGVLANYNITNTGAEFTINKRNATWTTDPNSKTYGDADPIPLTTGSGDFLVADGVTATYSRMAGETVAGSPYHITATLSATVAGALDNYNITNNGANFTINKLSASVAPDAKSKVYGSTDPMLTGTLSGFLIADGVTATYSRTAGETVAGSPYTISATLSPTGVLANYDITYNTANFTINKADPIVTATGNICTYDGNPCPGSGSAIGVHGENLTPVTVAYSDAPGPGHLLTSAPVNAGTYYVAARYAGDANYNAKQSMAATITINKAAATITLGGLGTYIYDCNPQYASAATTPSGLSGVAITYNGSLTAPTNPGSYAVVASLTNANYQAPDATGTLVIIARPIAYDQSVGTNEDTAKIIMLSASDLDSASLTFSIESGPAFGALSNFTASSCAPSGFGYNCTANITYTPNTNYNGADGFTFKVKDSDWLESNVATVSITVDMVNDKPQAQAQSMATDEDVPVVITLRGRDIDSAALSFNVASGPSHGSLDAMSGAMNCTPVPNSSTTQGASCAATVTYTPEGNYNGPDSFTFTTNDGSLDSLAATVSITVYPVNDRPTADAQSVTTPDTTPLGILLTGSDLETAAANLTFTMVTPPAFGTLSGTPPNVIYTPNFNYKGPDSFTFTVTDRGDPDNCGTPGQSCSDKKTSPPATVSISVTDGSAPQTLITSLTPASLSNDRNPIFGFTGSDNVTATDDLLFECSLDSGPYSPCGSPGNFTTQYTGLADGPHTFQVRAKDAAADGNTDQTPDNYSWTIDATPPDTVIDSNPPALANSATASFTFHSTENDSTLACSLDGGVAVDCTGGSKTYMGLSDGPHTFTVAATDLAGNVDPMPASFTWSIDTTAPHTTINNGPSNPTTSTSATFIFDSASSPGDSFECRLDGTPAGFAPCSSPAIYTGLPVGSHTFEVRGKDLAGNMETTPASYSWTIGAVTLENYAMDTKFKRFDGFEVVFGKSTGSSLKINSTNPDSFHYQIKLTNKTGTPIGAAYGNTATAIITVPGMPSYCGGVPCSSQIGLLGDPAFVVKGHKVAHVSPGYRVRDEDDDDDDMPVTIQYKSSGSCEVSSGYSSTLPSNGAPKCIKITGFSIPVKHAARIRINFQFRLKGTGGWEANSQQLFYAGFVFQAATSVNFGTNVQTAKDATGLVGAGKKATAIGGYVFNGATPGSGNKVRLFAKVIEASCTADTKLVAQDVVDANGFYYISRSGQNQHSSMAPSLPSGVQYAVQLCNGSTQIGLKSIDSRLREKEFEQVEFDY